MREFRIALSQHAIKHEFEFNIEKSDPGRVRAYCSKKKDEGCRWRLHASTMKDNITIKVRTNPRRHDYSSARRSKEVRNASKFWICEQVKDWLMEDASVGAKELQRRIKDKHKVHINYKRVYAGKELDQTQLFGSWDNNFNNLYRFKAEVERPYLAIDSTFLTGKFRGQLACAIAVDGHNWMYPVAVGVIDSETNENWIWFLQRLRDANGAPTGLAICTNVGQGVMAGVKEVFLDAEHRECMLHLVMNFKKRYNGKIFDDHLWPTAYSWSPYYFEKHWKAMEEAKPSTMTYIRQWHTRIWTRSQFGTYCKVDYVTNNLAECFNNWIKKFKGLNLDDLMDKIRQLIMDKWDVRRTISRKIEGIILPHIIKNLKEQSRNLDMDVQRSGDILAEVSVKGGSGYKCVVNLDERTCHCRKWQVSEIPCKHAIAFITSLWEPLEKHVDMYYSVQKFRAAYEILIPAMPDKFQWPQSDHGYFMHPPLIKSTSGRR
ncbi:uncharacterized protein [Miscanthus floridulus]|uniref:uncharacterized protein n=1 Tax=Miscanthus floridulus TaxID=154761 RepID=UPI0034581F9B